MAPDLGPLCSIGGYSFCEAAHVPSVIGGPADCLGCSRLLGWPRHPLCRQIHRYSLVDKVEHRLQTLATKIAPGPRGALSRRNRTARLLASRLKLFRDGYSDFILRLPITKFIQ
jgi:hypothetical protein